MIQNLAWTVGLRLFELPEEIQEKLSHPEKEYFKKHSLALESYMSKVDLDLNVDMVPPKDPYIKVRVLGDVGEGIVVSDKAANFARHSMHFLKRTDAELYISREELLNEVAKECSENFLVLQSLIRKMQEEGLDFQTARNADHYGALINHLSLIRNKRCLMAFV
ncbi:hypothetical protein LWI29_034209 [Acer saccharum]|uniref:DNA replication complex GINS protein PSF1 C-terminal domain-containing protein n=1 Tax=Acer saccharum TaxID=4024 RepID=A0AA39VZW0_ACESA|nr:hypothetical protein LWI29_034209 [Acer saccharum]